MVWMPKRCQRCGSDVIGKRCDNTDASGVPCWGMSDTDAALYRARAEFALDKIGVEALERRIETALSAPPARRFPSILQIR